MSQDLLDDDLDLDALDPDDERNVTLKAHQLRALRQKAKANGDDARELSRLRAEKKVRAVPGLADLNDDQVAALTALTGTDSSAEQIAAKATALGFTATEVKPVDDQTDLEAEEAAAKATAGPATPPGTGQLTPDEVAEWATDRLLALKDKYPEVADALLQGENAPRPAGF